MRLVHYSSRLVESLYAVPQREAAHFKPKGLWVSDDDCEENWRSWCLAEEFSLNRLTHVHDVALAPGARILRMRDAYDIDAFTAQYGNFEAGFSLEYVFWNRVSLDYQGVVISPYVWERRLDGGAMWYYAWDCASGCVWDPAAIAAVTLREIIRTSDLTEASRSKAPKG